MPTESRTELLQRQKQLQAIYPQVREELMRIPGVVKVGIGIKETAGQLTGEIVFRVYVAEKKPLDAVSPAQRIPKEIRGFKTDVVIVRPDFPEEDTDKYRPVKGGTQIGAEDSGSVGTLGCLAHLISDNSVVVLSNHHVLYDGTATDGSEIGQPQHTKSCCCTCNEIAVNIHGINRGHLDCAIARLNSGIGNDGRIKEIGFITGVNSAVAGEAVKKRGRTTGLTTGNVTNLTFGPDGLTILEIEVRKNNGQDRFSRPGDSGSALLNAANEIIGLHKSGNNGETVTPGNFHSTSVAIGEVLEAFTLEGFQISIITGVGGDESLQPELARVASLSDALWAVELRLRETQAGRQFWDVVQRHQREAIHLVNEVRPVTVIWHRNKGATFVAALGRSAKEPSYRLPENIEGVSRREAASNIVATLGTHASAALRADLETYATVLTDAFTLSDSVEEMISRFERTMSQLPMATV